MRHLYQCRDWPGVSVTCCFHVCGLTDLSELILLGLVNASKDYNCNIINKDTRNKSKTLFMVYIQSITAT